MRTWRSRILLASGVILLVLLALILGLLLFLQSSWLGDRLRVEAVSFLEGRYPVEVTLDALRLRPFGGAVEISGFCLSAAATEAGEHRCLVGFDRLRLSLGLWQWLTGSGAVTLRSIELDGLILNVRQEANGRLNLVNLFAPSDTGTRGGGSGAFRVQVSSVSVRDAEIRWENQRLSFDNRGGEIFVILDRLAYSGAYIAEVRLRDFDLKIGSVLIPVRNIDASFEVGRDRMDFEAVRFSGGGVMGEAAGVVNLGSPVEYRFDYSLQTVLPQLRWPDLRDDVEEGVLNISGSVEGEGGKVIGRAVASGSRLTVKRLPFEDLRVELGFDSRQVRIRSARFWLFGGLGEATAEIPWKGDSKAVGTVQAQRLRLQAVLRNWGVTTFPLEADLDVEARATWPGWGFSRAEVLGTVSNRVFVLKDREIEPAPTLAGEIPFRLQDGWVRFFGARVGSSDTSLLADGRVNFRGELEVFSRIQSSEAREVWAYSRAFGGPPQDFVLQYPFRPAGRLEGEVDLRWDPDRGLDLTTTMGLEEARYGDESLGSLKVDLRLDPDHLEIARCLLEAGDYRVDGGVIWRRPTWDLDKLRIATRGVPLQRLERLGWLEPTWGLEGRVTGVAEWVAGKEGPGRGKGDLTWEEGTVFGEAIPRMTASIETHGTVIERLHLEGEIWEGTVTGDGRYDPSTGTMDLRLSGSGLDLQRVAVLPEQWSPTGDWQVALSAQGSLAEPRWTLEAQAPQLTWRNQVLEEVEVTGRGDLREADVALQLVLEGTPCGVEGVVSLQSPYTFRLSGRTDKLFLASFLAPRFEAYPEGLEVSAGVTFRLEGSAEDLAGLVGEGSIKGLTVTLGGGLLVESSEVRWKWQENRLVVPDARFSGKGTDFVLSGWAAPAARELSFEADGEVNLALLQFWDAPAELGGTAAVELNVFGGFDSPRIVGTCELDGLQFGSSEWPVQIRDGEGRIRFTAGQIAIDGVRLESEYGTLQLSGGVFMEGWRPQRWQVNVSGQGLRVEYPEGLESRVDADVDYVQGEGSSLVTGTIIVRSAEYRRDLTIPELVLMLAGGGPSSVPRADEPSVALDLLIQARRSLRVDNNLAELVGSADLRVTGSIAHPVLLGTLTIEEGNIELEQNVYELTQGTITFSDPRKTSPYFNLEAETTIRNYAIQVEARGLVEQLRLNFRSDPPLSTGAILTLLAAGQTPEEMFGTTGSAQGRTGSLAAFGAGTVLSKTFGAAVTNEASRLLGFDRISIDPFLDESISRDPGARISLGKRIGSDVSITYISSFANQFQEQGVILEYRLTDWLTAVGTSRTDGTVSLDFKIRRRF
jgi:hypothetical protein